MGFCRACPTCRAKEKIVERCNKCLSLVCNNCSIWGYCVDCYVEIQARQEVSIYREDKLIVSS